MSITRNERLDCACGTPLDVLVVDSLNATRHPHLKAALLERTLHVFSCGVCGAPIVLEKDLLYFDFDRKQFFCMYPRHERAREAACSAEVKLAYARWLGESAPKFVSDYGKDFLVRACFGYEELREKVAIDDAGLADLVVEALKIDLLVAEPWFRANDVITLRFDRLLPSGELAFVPEWVGAPRAARTLTAARALYDEIDEKFDDILVKHPGLAGGAHVSLLRLISWPDAGPLGRAPRL